MRSSGVVFVGGLLAAVAGAACGPAADPDVPNVDVATTEVAATPGARTHAIRLSWPAATGHRGTFHAVSDEVTTKRAVDPPNDVEEKRRFVDAKGILEIVHATADGSAASLRLSNASMRASLGEGREVILDGATIVIDRAADAEQTAVLVDGARASQDVREALDEVVSLALSKGPSDDQVFGTRKPRVVGESWPVPVESARRTFAARSIRVPEGAITGEMKLAGVDVVNDVECLEVVGSMRITSFEPLDVPVGTTFQHALMDVQMRSVTPTVPMPRLEQDLVLTADILMTVDGRMFEIRSRNVFRGDYEPLTDMGAPVQPDAPGDHQL
ncbi:MAG: hypothetical protein HOW73_18510 [Polyangiaceae bacterium]|nr:hypothetical protein [Polyangiaceae bacterium]